MITNVKAICASIGNQMRLEVRWKWAIRHSCKKCLTLMGVIILSVVAYACILKIMVVSGSSTRVDGTSRTAVGISLWQWFVVFTFVGLGLVYFIGMMTAAARIKQTQTNLLIYLFGFSFFLTLLLGLYAADRGDLVDGNFANTPFGQFLAFLVAEVLNLKASIVLAVAPFALLIAPQILAFLILGPMGYAVPLRLGRGIVQFMLGAITKGFLTCAAVLLGVQALLTFNDWPGQSTIGVIVVSEALLVSAAAACWAWAEVNAGLAMSEVGAVTACVGRNSRRKWILNGEQGGTDLPPQN